MPEMRPTRRLGLMLTDTTPTNASAATLARSIANRQLSSAEVVDAHLRRIEAVNPRLNAVVQLRADAARAEAAAADNSPPKGPLHGVPITIKDAFDVAGMVCTTGTRGRREFVPTQDATAVARLRAAGAIVLGLTNTPELTLAFETDNLVYGRTNNPYDVDRTSGGSSGGEAAIIACGGSPLGLGTDIGGSVRVPAHYCGIAGLKPTLGRIPTTGAFPPAVGVVGGLYHVGPLARTVEDLDLALRVLAGPDGLDRYAAPVLVRSERPEVRQLRVAVYTDNGVMPADAGTAAAVRTAAEALKEAGASVAEARPDGIEQAFMFFGALLGADDGATVQHLLAAIGTTEPSPQLLSIGGVLHQFAMSTAELAGMLAQLDLWRMRQLGFLSRFDAVLSPVTATPAVPHGATVRDDTLPGFSYTMQHDLTGWPAATVRAGTSSDGLPIGVQIAAAPWREDVVLALASEIETRLGGWQPPAL